MASTPSSTAERVVIDERGASSAAASGGSTGAVGVASVRDCDVDADADPGGVRAALDERRGPDGRLRPLGPRLVLDMPPMVA